MARKEPEDPFLARFRKMSKPVRVVYARPRTFIAIAVGMVAFFLLPNSLRLVTRLETPYPGFDGLNLSWEALEGLAKHNGPVRDPNWAMREANAGRDLELGSWPGLEAQVAAIADDIAYDNHDIDDGLRAGIIAVDELVEVDARGQEGVGGVAGEHVLEGRLVVGPRLQGDLAGARRSVEGVDHALEGRDLLLAAVGAEGHLTWLRRRLGRRRGRRGGLRLGLAVTGAGSGGERHHQGAAGQGETSQQHAETLGHVPQPPVDAQHGSADG